ncbi:MAG: phosphoribosylformylglycinamidine synthase subunit PurS [Gemmatimonadota bacterium]|nr:phosphoribosylformylglycinamidine synthase subunit PurS [Gemmatimonadota bacterium]
MSHFRVEVLVIPRPGLLDPQGKAVHHALHSLGWNEVGDVRMGKAIHIDIEAESEAEATERVDAMCRKLLANPVTEDYEISVVDTLEPTGS